MTLVAVEDRDDEAANPVRAAARRCIEDANKQLELTAGSWKGRWACMRPKHADEAERPADHRSRTKRPFAMPKKKIEPADYVFRAAAASTAGIQPAVPIEHVIREIYGSDEATQIITRAAVNPATTTVTGYAAELVQTGFGAFMDRLLADSIYAPLSDAGARYDLGRNGSLKIPYRATTPTGVRRMGG